MGIAFREFRHYQLFKPSDVVGQAQVWQGAQDTVPLTVSKPLGVTMQVELRAGMKVTLVYDGPVQAPIEKGQKIGTLNITAPDFPGLHVPVYAAELGVARATFSRGCISACKTLHLRAARANDTRRRALHHAGRRGGRRQIHPGAGGLRRRSKRVGIAVCVTREPGGSPGAEEIRTLAGRRRAGPLGCAHRNAC